MTVTGACFVLSTLPGLRGREQTGLGLRRAQEHEPRGTRVRARGRAELRLGHRRRSPAILRAGLSEENIQRVVVESLSHVASLTVVTFERHDFDGKARPPSPLYLRFPSLPLQ